MATSENSSGLTMKPSLLGTLKQYVQEFGPEKQLNINVSKAWKDWKKNFEMCMEIEDIQQDKKLKVMKILGGDYLRDKIEMITESEDYIAVIQDLDEHFEDKRNTNAIRHEFFNMKQDEDENIKQYAERCKKIGK